MVYPELKEIRATLGYNSHSLVIHLYVDPVDVMGGLHVHLDPLPPLVRFPFGVYIAVNYVSMVVSIWKSKRPYTSLLSSCII